jgi:hypothetical protein
MKRDCCNALYTTLLVNDTKDGFVPLELRQAIKGETKRVARIVFWDASGQFFFETFSADVPLEMAEEFIAEAKKTIKLR